LGQLADQLHLLWKQCDANGATCKEVPNDTRASYTLVSTNAGNTMRVNVTATNADGSGTTQSAQTAVIAAHDHDHDYHDDDAHAAADGLPAGNGPGQRQPALAPDPAADRRLHLDP
jgi:hypothetical protein